MPPKLSAARLEMREESAVGAERACGGIPGTGEPGRDIWTAMRSGTLVPGSHQPVVRIPGDPQ